MLIKLKDFSLITANSKKVIPNSVFVCLNGNKTNGLFYLGEAINNGATLVVSEENINCNINCLKVKNAKAFLANALKNYYEIDFNDFIMIGITGTDGKTTTAKMIYDAISQKDKVMYIGTLGIICNDLNIESNYTTLPLEEIFKMLFYAKTNNIKYIVMEVSSEGLLDKRLLNFRFDIAIFTNLSHEHLNTHKTMEKYYETKCILFKLLKPNGIIITNKEDEYGRKITSDKKIITYGLHKGDVITKGIKFNEKSTQLVILYQDKLFYQEIPFIGVYNIYNFLACFVTIITLFNSTVILNNLKPIPGRFKLLEANNKKVVIDFAHTPNGLDNLLSTIQMIYQKNIILVLGSQGEKDKSKRPILGMVADKYASKIILTSEDPKNEPILSIISDINQGIKTHIPTIILFRKKAIDLAIKSQQENDIIVIVGKGEENYEKINGQKYAYSDYEYTKKVLQ